jgi:hypothetical protein
VKVLVDASVDDVSVVDIAVLDASVLVVSVVVVLVAVKEVRVVEGSVRDTLVVLSTSMQAQIESNGQCSVSFIARLLATSKHAVPAGQSARVEHSKSTTPSELLAQ